MTPSIPYDCPEDVCKAVQHLKALRDRLGDLSAHPWNRHEPRETLWWLIPPDEDGSWPAHRLGKFVFEFNGEPNQLDVGLCVEKGVSAQAAEALDYPEGLVLDDDWMWPRFVADVATGSVTTLLQSISRDTGLAPQLVFTLKPQTSAGSPSIEGDVVAFAVAPDGSLVPSLDPPGSKLLRPFKTVRTDAELVAALASVDGYTWIDAYVMATFACGAADDATDIWSAERMWEGLLAPLTRWIGRR